MALHPMKLKKNIYISLWLPSKRTEQYSLLKFMTKIEKYLKKCREETKLTNIGITTTTQKYYEVHTFHNFKTPLVRNQ